MPFLPPLENIPLRGIAKTGSPSPPSGLGKGSVSEPAVNRSFSSPNARGNVSRFDSLLLEFTHLLVSVPLLRAPPDLRSFDAGRASGTLFFFQHGFGLCWLLLWRGLCWRTTSYFGPGLGLTALADSPRNS